jgi:uncharacterized repeat protein (TIGR03803 family)
MANPLHHRGSIALFIVLALGVCAAHSSEIKPKFKVLHAFTGGADGGGVFGGAVLDKAGNLYGTTSGGGAHNRGTVFELSPTSGGHWRETVLHSFCSEPNCSDGDSPNAGLTLDAAGNLYGANQWAIFELSPGADGWRFAVIYAGGCRSNLLLDKAGNLYGPFGRGTGHGGAISELIRASGWSLLRLFAAQLLISATDRVLVELHSFAPL